MIARDDWEIVWDAQPGPQQVLFDCPYREIFFGGARGGGKTDGVLGKWGRKALTYGRDFNAILFRKTMPSVDDAWERAKELYKPLGAVFNETTKSIRFKRGGRVRFRPLERISDAEKYQGQNLTDVWVEEAGVYADPAPIDRLFGALRSPQGVPTQMILTGNPGGAGQQWIKARYVDPCPTGMMKLKRKLPNGADHVYIYIPSRIQDNEILLKGDPDYINNLYLVGNEKLVEAWLNGDWNAIEGAFFDEFSVAKHVLKPFAIPREWSRFRSMDWGSASPSSIGWWAVVQDDYVHDDGVTTRTLPRGALVRYREWYTSSAPNKGLKLTSEQLATGIKDREATDPEMQRSVLDPAAFAQMDGPSIAERMAKEGVWFTRADNKRVATQGAMGGWDQLRSRLRGDGESPMIYFFDTCRDTIRTLPALQHDERNAEDVDTDQEDHAPDEIRYACMSRPYNKPKPKPAEDAFRAPTVKELLAEAGMEHD